MSPHAARLARGAVAWTAALLAIAGGTGVLYLLRGGGLLAAGPHVSGALSLQQLAGDAAQPLARVALAFGGAGLVAGIAVGALTRLSAEAGALIAATLCWLVEIAAGAGGDAIANSIRFWPRVAPQLDRQASWVAGGLVLFSAYLAIRGVRAALHPGPAAPPRVGLHAQPGPNLASTRRHVHGATIES